MRQDRRLAVVAHELGRHAAKELEGVAVAGQKVLLALAEAELDVQQAAVAQHHDKETQPAPAGAHRDHFPRTPIHLGALPRCERQCQIRFGGAGPHQLDVVLDDRDAARVALLAQQRQHLHGGVVMLLEQSQDVALEPIQRAGAAGGLAWPIGLDQPLAHGPSGQPQFPGDLGGAEPVAFGQLLHSAPGRIVDHQKLLQDFTDRHGRGRLRPGTGSPRRVGHHRRKIQDLIQRLAVGNQCGLLEFRAGAVQLRTAPG